MRCLILLWSVILSTCTASAHRRQIRGIGGPGVPAYAKPCSDKVAAGQASAFVSLAESSAWSKCPTDDYLIRFHRAHRTGTTVILDIGTNKGYSTATFYNIWAPQLHLNPRSLHEYYLQAHSQGFLNLSGTHSPCGVCADCKSYIAGGEGGSKLNVFGFEPSDKTYQLASKGLDRFFPSGGARPWGQWNISRAVVGAQNGTVPWQIGCNSELCSLSDSKRAATNMEDVPMVTVDTFIWENGIEYIDFLKIDTEGYDMDVIKGAAGALKASEFEHGIRVGEHS